MAETKVWLITGATRGLGLEIAKTALKAGHIVIACYRNKAKVSSTIAEIEALGGTWLQLDVVGQDVESQVQSVVAKHGRIDVLVNNAGYAILGSIEETSVDQIAAVFKTNFVGTLRTIQAALPSMRSRRSGTIVNISSATGINSVPGLGVYSSTKFAVEGVTEALQGELASFNIRVLLVEPGMMATDILDASGTGVKLPLSDAYRGTAIEHVENMLFSPEFLSMAASATKVAQRIIEAVDGTGLMAGKEIGLRLPLGKDAGSDIEKRIAMYEGLAKSMKDVWESV
ncbi:putative short chain oxidoreductase/dehydrogenase [Hypoxylon crocopeplum]|nr:putative short chain oxidoreductase/dehydrogenase [Hypoxylon crocopeplum]